MRRPFAVDISAKPEGYLDAVDRWLNKPDRQLHCELGSPKKRFFMSATKWFQRYTSVDIKRTCAKIENLTLDKERLLLTGELVGFGPLSDRFERKCDNMQLVARRFRDARSYHITDIYSFDIYI